MPVSQQNALVEKYCAVCHSDAGRSGGLSLEHFDAGSPDPGEAAMMLGKLKTGAVGAAGLKRPDEATIQAWIRATSEEASGASQWHVKRIEDPAEIHGRQARASCGRGLPRRMACRIRTASQSHAVPIRAKVGWNWRGRRGCRRMARNSRFSRTEGRYTATRWVGLSQWAVAWPESQGRVPSFFTRQARRSSGWFCRYGPSRSAMSSPLRRSCFRSATSLKVCGRLCRRVSAIRCPADRTNAPVSFADRPDSVVS